ncbi:hypothetical protein [Mycolicibacterium sp. lyk4-40-TYG-92]|uniref:hypothetical protein n=1 Tax=Mycolicibacterium sp. lyk4-40-TYG-92 TaxID=3040295 RepID=UPI00254FC3E2|nr:hypothetical protein [Mycolicibacterium sp. lyk4-40-TYG-92]
MSGSTLSPYQMLTAVRPRLLNRPADIGGVALLGQAISDVLDTDQPEPVILQLIADLESERSNAESDEIKGHWALPLAALLGVVRQHLHNRTVAAAALNPGSETLRDKVLGALDAGVANPTAIGEFVNSPTTVVSRVLRQLLAEGLVERAEGVGDKRQRLYRRLDVQPETDLTATLDLRSAPDPETAPALATRGLADTAQLVEFVDGLTHTNARTAAEFLPDLLRAGNDSNLSPQLRVSALGVAGVLLRSSGSAEAGEDALDLAESAEAIAERSGEDLLRARAAYDRARAGLFVLPQQSDMHLADLQRAEDFAGRVSGPAGLIRLGWCAYTRCLIEGGRDIPSAIKHGDEAVRLFSDAAYAYGQAAALTLVTRSHYSSGARDCAAETAQSALRLARKHGYLRLIAESSFWAAEVDLDTARTTELFTAAAEHFESVGSSHWQALSYASLEVAKAECHEKHLDADSAAELLVKLRELHGQMSAQDNSWAAAVLTRKIAVCARYAGDFDLAAQQFDEATKIYQEIADVRGVAVAQAGLFATERGHQSVRAEDREAALAAPHLSADDQAAREAVGLLDSECSELMLAF